MRKTFLALALGGILACTAAPSLFAQDNTPPPQNSSQPEQWGHHRMDPDAQLQRMTKHLGLTPDQQSQIRPILVDREQKTQALWQNQSLSREDRHSQMMSIHQDSNAKIEALLTDDQKQEFEAMQEHRGRHGMQGGDGSQPQQPQ